MDAAARETSAPSVAPVFNIIRLDMINIILGHVFVDKTRACLTTVELKYGDERKSKQMRMKVRNSRLKVRLLLDRRAISSYLILHYAGSFKLVVCYSYSAILLSIYQSKRCDDSPASSPRITRHNTRDERYDLLLDADLQGRGPKIALLAPEVGHRLAIVNLDHQI